MRTQAEKELVGTEKAIDEFSGKIRAILDDAERRGEDLTPDENDTVQGHFKAIKDAEDRKKELEARIAVEEKAREYSRSVAPEPDAERKPVVKSLGDQFINSDGYKRAKAAGFSGSWKTGQIDLSPATKTLLEEGDNIFLEGGTPAEGAALVPIDQRPGVVETLFQPNTIADLFASGTTMSNAINYVVESLADNGADVVPEGDTKPESALEFENAQEAVKKIATWLPVTDEMLEDAPALRAYINARLSLFVRNKEEEELLHGPGSAGTFHGLLPRIPAENKFVVSDAQSANAADAVFAALTVARRSFLEPDGIVVHPDDWAEIRLTKDQNDNYIGGSPFSNTGSNPMESLWGKRVVVTYNMIPGYGLVGAFGTAAQLFRKGGLTVEASNSHDTFFVENKTAIRAEQREVLAVYRPEAFAIADLGGAS